MQLPKTIIIKVTEDNQYFDISAIPPIDKSRIIAVYVRQSDKDADTEHGESLATQLALRELAVKLQNGREHIPRDAQRDESEQARKSQSPSFGAGNKG